MDLGIEGKVVVITGAAGLRGSIGETVLRGIAREGAIAVVLDRNERGAQYIEEIKARGLDGMFVKTDLTQPNAVENAITQVVAEYGRIDIVINNVGVNDGAGLNSSYDEFISSLKLNLASYFMVVKTAMPYLIKSKGNILNVGSKVAYTGQGGTSGYAAAKGGVLALTREWAVDLISHGIRVNCLIIAESYTPAYKAWIDSIENGEDKLKSIRENIPLENRMTDPEEIADQILFTISARSGHTTGQHIFVDGGYCHLDRALLSTKN